MAMLPGFPFSKGRQQGQSMVELAVFLMVILWLLAGAIDFGMGFLSYVAIRDAAQEGATYGSLHPADTADIIQRVRDSSDSPVDLSDTTSVHVDDPAFPDGQQCAGHPLTVTVTYDYPLMVPFLGLITGNPIHISAHSTSVILTPKCP
jgi:Flp pilus assembly protein TadG